MVNTQYAIQPEAMEMRDTTVKNGHNGMVNQTPGGRIGEPGTAFTGPIKTDQRHKKGKKASIRQVIALQEAVSEAGTLLRKDIAEASSDERAKLATSLASIATSWTRLQDVKREILGKGKPMPVPAKQSTPKRASFDIDEQPVSP